jgi:hypothetical protein
MLDEIRATPRSLRESRIDRDNLLIDYTGRGWPDEQADQTDQVNAGIMDSSR